MLDRAEQHIARSAGVARANVRIVGKERFDRGRACIVARMVCEEVPVAARGVDQLVADLVGEFGDRVAIAEYREPAPVTGADRFKRRCRQIRGFGDREGRVRRLGLAPEAKRETTVHRAYLGLRAERKFHHRCGATR